MKIRDNSSVPSQVTWNKTCACMIGGAYQYSEPRAAGLQDTGRDSVVPDIDSWFGIITFSWFTHVIHNAQKRVLQTTDATPLPSNCDATDTRMQLWNVWSETFDEDTYTTGIEGEKKRKSLLRAIVEIYGFEYACIGIHLFLASIFSFFGPILLHRLVVLAEQPQPNMAQIMLCALWLFLSRLMAAIFNTQYSFLSTAMSVRIGAAIKGCLFQKVLCLSTKSRRAYTTGIFSNLYTTDVERITDMVIQAHRFWVLPLQILVSMLLLYGVVGYAMFWGLFAVISVLVVNNYIARLSKVANDKVQAAKDIRMSAVSACFSSSLIIKLNVWENKFEQKIQKARNDELVHVWESLLIAAVNICLLWLAPCLVSSATIAAYGFSGDVKAAEIFTALSLFKSLQDPFRDLPGIITQYFQMKTSLERLQVLFEMPEKKHKNESMISPASGKNNSSNGNESAIHSGDVYIKKCTFTWDTSLEYVPNSVLGNDSDAADMMADESTRSSMDRSTGALLGNVDIEECDIDIADGKHTSKLGYRLVVSEAQILSRGKLMVVRGATGSGKSSFVSALLGDMYVSDADTDYNAGSGNASGSGSDHSDNGVGGDISDDKNELQTDKPVSIDGSIGYTSQITWIQNDTVLSNILMGLPLVPAKLQRIIDACTLGPDLKEFPLGLYQPIGERGVGLSGGQKARVALARCMYSDADIIILDDVFAALDTVVGRSIFEKGVLQLLKCKTVILVTHNIDILNSLQIDVVCTVEDGVVSFAPGPKLEDKDSASVDASIEKVPYRFAQAPWEIVDANGDADDSHTEENTDFNNDSDSATDSDLNEDFKLERNHSYYGRPHIDSDSDEDEGNSSSVKSYSNNRNKFIAKKKRAKSRKARGKKTIVPLADAPVRQQVSVYSEERAEGNISAHVYKGYLNAMGGWKVVAFLCVVQTVWQILGVSSDLWLAYWTSHDDAWQAIHVHRNVYIYATLSIASGLTVFVRTYTISKGGYDAAKSLFERMNHAVLYAPMSWIDVNPSGRILNRFSDDVSKIDLNMPFAVGSCFATVFNLGGSLLAVAIITKWLVIIVIPISYAYVTVMRWYIKASREVQRLQQMSVSPVLSYMSEISVGASIINAFDAQQRYIDENDRKVNNNSTMMYCAATAQAWFVIRVQFLGCIMLFFIVIFAFISQSVGSGDSSNASAGTADEDDIGASLIGLSLAYGLQLSDELQFVVMILSWFENSMVSPERVLQYCAIKSEGTEYQKRLYHGEVSADDEDNADADESNTYAYDADSGIELNPLQQNTTTWVTQGRITYRGVSFRYQPTSEDILIDLNFDVLAGQKIGIVGRTGSGKSSLSMSLFRVAELSTGSIHIDGINISDIPLSQLRAGVEIIPQSPIVLKGTVRMNVDPFDQYTDTEVHEALRKTYMLKSITNLAKSQAEAEDSDANANGNKKSRSSSKINEVTVNTSPDLNKPFGILYALLDESGGNLSVGEKQLLVMARALLSQSKILILDEATANVDSDTDVHIRLLLQKEFTNSTVLTIAHRLHTVMGCDRILVMEQGRIAEYDTPQNLLDTKGSIFENLVAAEEAQRK